MKKFIAIFMLVGASFSAHAASVIIQAGATPAAIKSSEGSFINAPAVQLGFFKNITSSSSSTVIDSLISSLAGNTAEDRARVAQFITDNFVPIGTGGSYGTAAYTYTDVSSGGKTVTGNITGITFVAATVQNPASSQTSNGLVAGTKVFAILADNSNYAEATQLGVISASTWNSPGSASPSFNINFGSVDTAAEVYRGSIGSIVLSSFSSVPEPSSMLLFVLGAVSILRRKR